MHRNHLRHPGERDVAAPRQRILQAMRQNRGFQPKVITLKAI